jgi:hypothetical protein
MPRKRYKPEEIVAKPCQVDILVAQGQATTDATRQIGLGEVTSSRSAISKFNLSITSALAIMCIGACPLDILG